MPPSPNPDLTITPAERCSAFLTAALRLIGEAHRSASHAGMDSQDVLKLEQAMGRIRDVRNGILRRAR